jgi:hypothetical protein
MERNMEKSLWQQLGITLVGGLVKLAKCAIGAFVLTGEDLHVYDETGRPVILAFYYTMYVF